MVDLDAQRAAEIVHRDPTGQRTVLRAQGLELTQSFTGRPPELGMVALRLELGEHGKGQHDRVLLEPEHRLRVSQHDRRVDHEGLRSEGTAPLDETTGARRQTKIGHETPTGSGTRAYEHAAQYSLCFAERMQLASCRRAARRVRTGHCRS